MFVREFEKAKASKKDSSSIVLFAVILGVCPEPLLNSWCYDK